MTIPSSHPFILPFLCKGNFQALHLESVLKDLSLHHFKIDLDSSGWELAEVFEKYPSLPGAILVERGTFIGIISRQRLLEFLIRPHGLELFLKKPVRVLSSYARCEMLLLPGETPILTAAQQALRRSPDLLSEPIVVQLNQTYYLLDSHELNIAHWQIRGIETQVRYERTQAQMIQNDKMANLGRLVDGVAHEILDPISFIWGNLSHIAAYSQELLTLLDAYEQVLPQPPHPITQLREAAELDYLRHDLPRVIESIKTGAERLSKLASSLQNFCHIDEVYPKPTDLHESIDSILLLLKSRLTTDIQIHRHYGHLPPVLCYPGQLNQVFMNIFGHLLDQLLDQAVSQQPNLDFKARRERSLSPETPPKPMIAVTTRICSLPTAVGRESRWISICIADNGPGLSPKEYEKLLKSFSVECRTEKETSFAVSYQIVTAKHGGKFWIRSRQVAEGEPRGRPGERGDAQTGRAIAPWDAPGTEFEILLPLT